MNKPEIGFIGLGLMGSAMVGRLQDKGYALTLLANRSRAAIETGIARGAVEAKSAKALAERCDIIMLCMDTSNSVESRMLGDEGVIAGLKPGSVVIDFGTSLPASTKMLSEKVKAAGCAYLDAPLGRTPAHAKDGLLNIMTAGDKVAYDSVLPVLQDVGENVFHLGPSGNGHAIKLMNNFFGMTIACAMSEVFAIADKAGIDRQQVHDVIAAGPLNSSMMGFVSGYALHGDASQLAFSIQNAAKDVGYYSQMVEELGVDSMMSGAAKQALELAKEQGAGDQMVSQMVSFFSDQYQ